MDINKKDSSGRPYQTVSIKHSPLVSTFYDHVVVQAERRWKHFNVLFFFNAIDKTMGSQSKYAF